MADGDVHLDAAGNVILNAAGERANSCGDDSDDIIPCSDCEPGQPRINPLIPRPVSITVTGALSSASTGVGGIPIYTADGSFNLTQDYSFDDDDGQPVFGLVYDPDIDDYDDSQRNFTYNWDVNPAVPEDPRGTATSQIIVEAACTNSLLRSSEDDSSAPVCALRWMVQTGAEGYPVDHGGGWSGYSFKYAGLSGTSGGFDFTGTFPGSFYDSETYPEGYGFSVFAAGYADIHLSWTIVANYLP